MEKKEHDYSWGLIIFLLVIFWPVGLLLMYLKISEERQNNKSENATQGGNRPLTNIFRPQQPPTPPKQINCSGCGAPNMVRPGVPSVCEYCGKGLS